MMKKRFTLLLVLLLALGSAAGCSGASGDGPAETGSSVSAEADTREETENTVSGAKEFDFEEMTVLDTEECAVKITAVGEETDEYTGEEKFSLTVNMENKTPDRTFCFRADSLSVNGLVTSAYFSSADILPQKKANEKVEIDLGELKALGVTDVTDIEIFFSVVNTEDYSNVAWQAVHVYPYGEEKAASYIRETKDTDVIFADNELATGTVVGYGPQSDYGFGTDVYTAELFLQNTSDQDLLYTFSDMSVNGYMVEPYINFVDRIYIPAGECGFMSLVWEKETLESCGIETMESLGFTYSAESYNRENKSLVDDREFLGEETVSVDLK